MSRKHRGTPDPNNVTREEFANAYECRGECAVSAHTTMRAQDPFFGQWLVLHAPFRKIRKLLKNKAPRKAPGRLKYFASALYSDVGAKFWRSKEAVRRELE